MDPKISIIMPVYNAKKFLSDTIRSILNQTYKEFELIIIDDGSNDGSGEITDKYSKEDPRIKVIHTQNQGICKARNLGIKVSKGEYITFADHDDILDKNLIKENLEMLINENADWIKFGKIEHIYRGDQLINKNYSNFQKGTFDNKQLKEQIITLRCNGILTYVWDSIFKKSIINKLKLSFDENFKYGNEDIDFCQRYIEGCGKMIISNKNYYHHFTRMGISTSSKFAKEKIDSHLYLAKKSIDMFNYYNVDLNQFRNEYLFLLGRYVVFNVCRDLNNAPPEIKFRDKKKIIKEIRENIIFSNEFNFNRWYLLKKSIKITVYLELFIKRMYWILLLFDKYSKKIIYSIRLVKKRLINIGGI